MSTDIDQVIAERTANYGAFTGVAELSQALKDVLRHELAVREKELAADQLEALEMILHKIARIANGNADYPDSWEDVSGYATLVVRRLRADAALEQALPGCGR